MLHQLVFEIWNLGVSSIIFLIHGVDCIYVYVILDLFANSFLLYFTTSWMIWLCYYSLKPAFYCPRAFAEILLRTDWLLPFGYASMWKFELYMIFYFLEMSPLDHQYFFGWKIIIISNFFGCLKREFKQNFFFSF